MILRIFLAAFLFVVVTAPIVCATSKYIIGAYFDHKMKFMATVLKAAGEQMSKGSTRKKSDKEEGTKQS